LQRIFSGEKLGIKRFGSPLFPFFSLLFQHGRASEANLNSGLGVQIQFFLGGPSLGPFFLGAAATLGPNVGGQRDSRGAFFSEPRRGVLSTKRGPKGFYRGGFFPPLFFWARAWFHTLKGFSHAIFGLFGQEIRGARPLFFFLSSLCVLSTKCG